MDYCDFWIMLVHDRYTWGLGSMGQLGHCSLQCVDKELLPRRVVALNGIIIKDISCGGVHTCALTDKGALYAWGGGQAGQLGLGPQNGFFSCTANGSDMLLRNIPALVIPTDVKLISCGHSHTLIYTKDGRIHGWGYNSYGQAANDKSTYAWYPSPVDWYDVETFPCLFSPILMSSRLINSSGCQFLRPPYGLMEYSEESTSLRRYQALQCLLLAT